MNIRWRERTHKMQLIRRLLSNFLSQHVSGIIMTIISCISPCPTACGVLPGCVGCGWLWSCGAASLIHSQPQPTHPGRTPHAVGHGLILLMMVIMMPETCWNKKLDNKLRISCILWVLSLHLIFKHSSLCIVGLFHMCSVYCSLLPVIVCCALPFIGHLAVDSEC